MAPKCKRQSIEPDKLGPEARTDGLAVPVATCEALMMYASEDETRVFLGGLGLGTVEGWPVLAATDGHALLAIRARAVQTVGDAWRTGGYWSREVVTRALKVAKATGEQEIVLPWSGLADGFPPLEQVVPRPGGKMGAPALAPALQARLGAATDKLARATGSRGTATAVSLVLSSATGHLEPVRHDIVSLSGKAIGVIVTMPMRVDRPEPTGDEDSEAEALRLEIKAIRDALKDRETELHGVTTALADARASLRETLDETRSMMTERDRAEERADKLAADVAHWTRQAVEARNKLADLQATGPSIQVATVEMSTVGPSIEVTDERTTITTIEELANAHAAGARIVASYRPARVLARQNGTLATEVATES